MSKKVLLPQLIASTQTLTASFNTVPTVIDYTDNVTYQINVTTSNSTGTFAVQVSDDYVPPPPTGPAANAGTWVDLTLGGGTPAVAAANDSIVISLNQMGFRAVRLAYTSTIAGTGTANIYVMTKEI